MRDKNTKFTCVECDKPYDLDNYVYSSVFLTCVSKTLCWSCAKKITPVNLSEF